MANALSDKAREQFLASWLTDTFKVVALDASYVYSSAHDFLNDVGGGARIATSGALSSKTITNGVADAADAILAAVPTGDTITQLWVFKDTGVEGTSTLVAYFDRDATAALLDFDTNDGDINVRWHASGIFKL